MVVSDDHERLKAALSRHFQGASELTILQAVSDESRIIVSGPLGGLPGAWNEVPESSYGVVREGDDELRPFRPAYSGNGG